MLSSTLSAVQTSTDIIANTRQHQAEQAASLPVQITDTSQTPADRLKFPVDCRLSVDCKFTVDCRFSVDDRFFVDCKVFVGCNLSVGCRSWQQCGASRARCASSGGLFSAKPGGKRTCSTQKPWCRAAPTTCCSSISHHPRWEQHPNV